MHRAFTFLFSAALLTTLASSVTAGDLTPPAGPPAPTMKPLDEVEPRIAIVTQNTPPGVVSLFRISAPGSYYLTQNVTGVAGRSGIEIASSDVTIDLRGFTISGVPGSGSGIFAAAVHDNISIHDGVVRSWGGTGISLSNCSNIRIERVTAQSCGDDGISVGVNASLSSCAARENGDDGIVTQTGASISNCGAVQNTGEGIQCGGGTSIINCSTGSNGANGILAFAACTITECASFTNVASGIALVASGTTVSRCSLYSNTGHGVLGTAGCTIINCTVGSNTLDGIRVTSDCSVRGNTCDNNGNLAGDGAGIVASSSDNRIEGNNCTDGDRGIEAVVGGNFITRNTCSGNTSNWNIAAGNICLVVAATTAPAFNGNSGGAAPGSTDPNANFTY